MTSCGIQKVTYSQKWELFQKEWLSHSSSPQLNSAENTVLRHIQCLDISWFSALSVLPLKKTCIEFHGSLLPSPSCNLHALRRRQPWTSPAQIIVVTQWHHRNYFQVGGKRWQTGGWPQDTQALGPPLCVLFTVGTQGSWEGQIHGHVPCSLLTSMPGGPAAPDHCSSVLHCVVLVINQMKFILHAKIAVESLPIILGEKWLLRTAVLWNCSLEVIQRKRILFFTAVICFQLLETHA